jgi:hypothetical protein
MLSVGRSVCHFSVCGRCARLRTALAFARIRIQVSALYTANCFFLIYILHASCTVDAHVRVRTERACPGHARLGIAGYHLPYIAAVKGGKLDRRQVQASCTACAIWSLVFKNSVRTVDHSSETSLNSYWTRRRHISEDTVLHSHRCDNLLVIPSQNSISSL